MQSVSDLTGDVVAILPERPTPEKSHTYADSRKSLDPERIETVWVGEALTTDIAYDAWLTGDEVGADGVERLKVLLQDKGTVFRPW